MTDKLLLSIYRHWVWSDRIKELFEFYFKQEGPLNDFTMADFFHSSLGTCMCLWYALLYATCEGLESGKVDIAHEVVDRYAEVRDELRRFRNAVFHVQANLEPDKLMDVFESESMVPLVRSLHEQIGKYVLREIRQLPSYQEGVEDHMA